MAGRVRPAGPTGRALARLSGMDWLRDHLWETWLGVAIVLAVAEMFSLDLFLAMLAVGALAGMGTAIIVTDSFAVQALVAAGVSVAMIGVVRPSLARRLHHGPELVMGMSRLVGERAVVTEEITTHAPGRIKLAGETWSASSADAEGTIGTGRTVVVVSIDGATAFVRPASDADRPADPPT